MKAFAKINLLLTCFTLSGFSFSQDLSLGGNTHFQGVVTPDVCEFKTNYNTTLIYITCVKKGMPVTKYINVNSLNDMTFDGDAPIKTSVQYLDKEAKLALLTAMYN